ncbi:MAG TPA: hypothetical protein VFA59_17365 [Vicinamibacterales bacterium]|nr:hypothetical protein [Vicinamibacterales bacterium]
MRTTRWGIALATALVLFCGWIISAQTLATRHVMEVKLAHSQRILESLMMSDFETLQRESEALSQMTSEAGWAVLGTPEYSRYSGAFKDALTDLRDAATRRDLDASMLHYTNVTMTCYRCHRYVKNARIAHGSREQEGKP